MAYSGVNFLSYFGQIFSYIETFGYAQQSNGFARTRPVTCVKRLKYAPAVAPGKKQMGNIRVIFQNFENMLGYFSLNISVPRS